MIKVNYRTKAESKESIANHLFKFKLILISQKGRDFRLISASFTVLLSLWMHFGEGKAAPCDFVSSHTKQQQLLIHRVKHCRKIRRRWLFPRI